MEMKSLVPDQIIEHKNWIKRFEEKYSFRFFEPTYKEVPNVSELFDDKKKSEPISRLEYYLLGTYPIDMGTNAHQEMHNLRQSFSKEEYKWHQRHNKLGLNCWGTLAGLGLIRLNMVLNRDDLTINPFPETGEYASKSFDDKLKLCISVDKKLYALLEKLHSDYR
jgi:hypothetical protein